MSAAHEHLKHAQAVLHEETFAAFRDDQRPAERVTVPMLATVLPRQRYDGDATFPEPEDRGKAVLSELGQTEYIDDLIRPGRITLVAAEESTGKSFAITGELAIRVAVAGGSFAETWPVRETGRVLVLSEMHPDDDYQREETVLAAVGRTRSDLRGCYYRLGLSNAALGAPPLQNDDWRSFIADVCAEDGIVLMVFDTATGATDVDPWGREIQSVYRNLRAMLELAPELAIVLIVHLKKPQGRGERRLSDVLGEWGRWCDVVLLMESEGTERTRLTLRKRVRRERRIVVTKRDGLLVDPQDADSSGPKVPVEKVVAIVEAQPGLTFAELAAVLGVSKPTATNYVRSTGELMTSPDGPKGANRVWLTTKPPKTTKQEGFGGALAVPTVVEGEGPQTAKPPYIDRRLALRSETTAVPDSETTA
ncbi:hypothetical protein BH23CHL7_BH23CHL7_20840 [soil metagenome]